MFKLSYVSKMAGYSWDLPARVSCPVCSEVCDSCYGVKGRFIWFGPKKVRHDNFVGLQEKEGLARWEDWIVPELLNLELERFRFHSTGDVFSLPYYKAILRVCVRIPGIACWLPTHNYKAVAEVVRVPPNLSITLSSLPGTEQEKRCKQTRNYLRSRGVNVRLSYMLDGTIPEGVYVCPCSGRGKDKKFKNCKEAMCGRCWYGDENVGFIKH